MGRTQPLVHPRMLASQAAFFPERVTIQKGTPSRNSVGQPVTVWDTAPGVPPQIPAVIESLAGREVRTPDEVGIYQIGLNGYYPAIDEAYRAVDSAGTAYDILSVDHDGKHTATVLEARTVT
jgi:hypothetical protein